MESTKAPTAVRAAALFFPCLIVCSVGMILLNKTLSVGFPHPNTILGLQNGASVVYLWAGARILGIFDLSVPFRPSQFRPFLYPTLNWVVMLALSLKMLQYNSVATMVMFKTLGTILTCTVEIFLLRRSVLSQRQGRHFPPCSRFCDICWDGCRLLFDGILLGDAANFIVGPPNVR